MKMYKSDDGIMSAELFSSFLEKFIIEDWNLAPKDVLAEAIKSNKEFIPTAISNYKNNWYVLHCGQGSYIAYGGIKNEDL
jgi:hypothetical protein